MKLFKLTQSQATGYDTYDSVIVAAPSITVAVTISPVGSHLPPNVPYATDVSTWCTSPADVTATYIGDAADGTMQGVVLASFNAG